MYATNFSVSPAPACMSHARAGGVDFIEAGAGRLVVLVHSSMAGAHQWSVLMRDLQDRFQLRAVNLFGYGKTPPWSGAHPASLDDFAELVAMAVPKTAKDICLIGHSLGGAVALQAAACQLRGRVKRMVLIEPSLFGLLERSGRREAFREILELADNTRRHISNGMPEAAAERFIDYWCGAGTWAASSPDRKASFTQSVELLLDEWKAALGAGETAKTGITALPRDTLVMCSSGATGPSREIVEVLLHDRPDWQFARIDDAGHMAPLTHPHAVNSVIKKFMT